MNKIYRVIWNSTLMQWVVTSELGRGKIKRAAAKVGVAVVLGALLSPAVVASTCNPTTFNCQLDNQWSPATNNQSSGAVTISDGNDWNLTGPAGFTFGGTTYVIYSSINQLIADGYINNSVIDQSLSVADFGSLSKTIIVYDPITQSNKTVNVYNSSDITSHSIDKVDVGVIKNGPADIYISSRFATVSDGSTADVDLGNISIGGAMRDSKLIYVDGNSASTTTATVKGNINLEVFFEQNPLDAPLIPLNVVTTTYTGTFTTFNGGSFTVNSISDLQNYNNWLIEKLSSGELDYNAYLTEFAKATANTAVVGDNGAYIANKVGPAADPSLLTTPTGNSALLYADGANAVAILDSTARVSGSAGMDVSTSVFSLHNKSTGINNGNVAVSYRTANIDTGATFINNGSISNGELNGRGLDSPIMVHDAGSTFINNGTVSSVPSSWSYTPAENMINYNIFAHTSAKVINNGVINASASEAYLGRGLAGAVFGLTFNGATGYNSPDGNINVGHSPDGYDVYAAQGSAGVYATGNTQFDNAGTITLGTKTNGSYGIYAAYSQAGSDIVNSGKIVINSNGEEGAFIPQANIGIFGENYSQGLRNTGAVEINGINSIGIKALSGAAIASSGVINVNSATDLATGLRNYGVWSEGAGSVVDISGTVNLIGDGAIGAHARDQGNITVSSEGQIVFGGANQLGYYVYGPTASITNNGTGAQDVSTQDSVLFRVDGGAGFTGGAGAASVLTASGQGSTSVVANGTDSASGKVSAFNSGGMTLNLSGEEATGVLIQGGAQGKISSDATINMTATGAVAGIADGQGYDINGKAVGSAIAGVLTDAALSAGAAGFGSGTVLVTEAALNSALDAVTGYIARNGAEVSNAGNIVFTGNDTTGLLVEAGARGDNTGSITAGAGGTGIVAQDASGANTTVVNTSGNLVLNGGDVSQRTTGIIASGAHTTVNMTGGTVTMNGNGATGVRASEGATVNLSGTATPNFSSTATDQILFAISGAGSTINTSVPVGTVLDASGERSTLFRLEDGAVMSGDIQVAASGKDATAVYATGAGTAAEIGSGSQMDISGNGATGVYASGGATATIANGATLALTGSGAIAGVVDGNTYADDGTLIETGTGAQLNNAATISSTVEGATAFIAKNSGTLDNSGDILLTGANSTAIQVLGGNVNNTGNITANGTALYVGAGEQGQPSTITNSGTVLATDGRAAIELAAGSLNLVGSGVGTIEARGSADGVRVSSGATGLDVTDAHIIVNAAGATGNGIENAGNLANLQLSGTTIDVADGAGVRTAVSIDKTNSGTINVSGAGVGIAFENADGSATIGDLDLSGSADLNINVTGAGGSGIRANTIGSVDTAANIHVSNELGGAALVLGSGVISATNRGSLSSDCMVAAVVDTADAAHFTNTVTGVITASSSGTAALAMNTDHATVDNAGIINGDVVMHGANGMVNNTGSINKNIVTTSGDNAITVDGGFVAGDIILNGSGNNTVLLTNGAEVNTVSGSAGNDTVTIQGNGNTFTALNGDTGTSTAVFDAVTDGFHMDGVSAQINDYDQLNLRNGSLLFLDSDYVLGGKPAGGAGVDIDATSVLAVNGTDSRVLANALTGNGTVAVDNSGASFDFATTTGSDFAGIVDLSNATLTLGDVNTSALTHATLKANAGSVTTVADGEQAIGGLTFAGGEMVFNGTAPDQKVATSHVTTGTLDASGSGSVQINVPAPYVPGHETATTSSLMTQDDANIGLELISAGMVTGSGGNLVLTDQNGNTVTSATQVDIAQSGNTVAKGTYDYRLTTTGESGNQDGLYVNYGLKELELLQDQTLILDADPGATGAAADQSARITGNGNLAIRAENDGLLSLSNSGNDYTGETTVLSGTLRTDADGVLGNTALLAVNDGAKVDLNGTLQTAGALVGYNDSALDFNGGSLTLRHGGISSGRLYGGGELNVDGGVLRIDGANGDLNVTTYINNGAEVDITDALAAGTGKILDEGVLTLTSVVGQLANNISGVGNVNATDGTNAAVSGDNSGFSGVFSIDSGSNLTVGEQRNLGTAAVNDNGMLTVDTASQWTLNNTISGSGNLTKTGAGTLTLTQDSAAYTGTTDITTGELALGSDDATAVNMDSQLVNVHDSASFTGYGSTRGDVNVMQGGVMQMTGFTTGGNLTNSGSVLLTRNDGQPGNTLTVNGNYNGNNGLLAFNTKLGGDDSPTDKLTVHGDTAGNTRVSVTNIGGTGAQTVNGIEMVQVDGSSAGNFALTSGTVEAGAYVYTLAKGSGAANKNWYLTSKWSGSTPPPLQVVDPSDPSTPPVVDPHGPSVLRPEAGSYISNLAAANSLFNQRLHDRLGEPQYTDALRNGKEKVSSMWMRHVGGHERSSAGDGQLKTQSNRYVLQLGGDIAQWSADGADRWHLGVMGGYANEHSNTRSNRVGYSSDGRISGYSAGLYGTWYQNDADKTGVYVDSWMQYNWFNSSVESDNRESDSYQSKGLTASLEAGYTLKAGEFYGSEGTLNTWYVQPQAQVTWMGVKDNAHTRRDGTRIETEGSGNIQTRLGVRTYLNSHHKMDEGKGREFQPFVEVNWIHNTDSFSVKMDGQRVSRDGAANLAEIRTGVEGKLSDNLSVWGNIGVQVGDKGYNDTQGMLGVKYGF